MSTHTFITTSRKRGACASAQLEKPAATKRRKADGLSIEQRDDNLSDTDSDGQSDVDDGHHGVSTPSTPQSARDWPSLKKFIRCTFPGCDKTFNRQAKLRDHLHYHTGQRPFECPHSGCDRSFPRKTHLSRHVKSAHTDVRDYRCPYAGCGKAFSTGTRLRRHESSHEKRLQFKCGHCGQEFRKHATLQKHVATEHHDQKLFVCDEKLADGSLCSAEFDRATGLSGHKARIHGTPKYSCTICSLSNSGQDSLSGPSALTFSTYTEFKNHNRVAHPPSCSHCQGSFDSARQLSRHLELDHGIILEYDPAKQAASYTCPELGCGRSFTKKGNLQVHIKNVHLQARPFVCDSSNISTLNNIHGWDGAGACGRDFKAKAHLEEHIRTVHLGLEHRHKARRTQAMGAEKGPAPNKEQDQNKKSVGKLTGAVYQDYAPEALACVLTGCGAIFERAHDLDLHLHLTHGFDDNEVQIARWSRPAGNNDFNQDDGEDISNDFTNFNDDQQGNEYDDNESTSEIDGSAARDGVFWIGGMHVASGSGELEGSDESWDFDHEEMQELVGEGHGWEDDILIDPALEQ